jgi:hypothetical protein
LCLLTSERYRMFKSNVSFMRKHRETQGVGGERKSRLARVEFWPTEAHSALHVSMSPVSDMNENETRVANLRFVFVTLFIF